MARRERNARSLTELEGAALSVIYRLGRCTPYQVRLDFQKSRSHEWSGSAGAVYPALRRLQGAGLLDAQSSRGGRRSVIYSLSKNGRNALARWLSDVERASGSGLDPFRCRADYWSALKKRDRTILRKKLIDALNEKCADIAKVLGSPDNPEPRALELELALHKMRLQWFQAWPG